MLFLGLGVAYVGFTRMEACEKSWAADLRADESRKEQERTRAAEQAKATADEANRSADASAAQRAREAEVRRAPLVKKYVAMKPWQRLAEVQRLCPAVRPPNQHRTIEEILSAKECNDDDVLALLEAVRSTPEEKTIDVALEEARSRREAEQRAASRKAKCCDGTISDGCTCRNAGAGCCSHHGGVCGCE